MNDCICLTMPTQETCDGYIFGPADGMWWIWNGPCPAHPVSYTVSPIWHPEIGWLVQDETATVAAAAVQVKAMETV